MEDFKYCMSNKSMHPEEKREAWIRRRAEWWAHRRVTKSSEEIWAVRTCVYDHVIDDILLTTRVVNR